MNTLPCVHRGPVIRTVACQLCGMRDQTADVFACAVHGECTARKYKYGTQPAICLLCPERKYPDGQEVARESC